ncbi:hypothetical protein LTR17_011445 [Elasticomyces elasticus]|nr:hypothetical protein LTR17_011445 [Elasticomyces elasticus]
MGKDVKTSKVAVAPLQQHEVAATAAVPAVNGTHEKSFAAPEPKLVAQRAVAKTEALKDAITHRPKNSSPLKACISAEPPALPARSGQPVMQRPRLALQASN